MGSLRLPTNLLLDARNWISMTVVTMVYCHHYRYCVCADGDDVIDMIPERIKEDNCLAIAVFLSVLVLTAHCLLDDDGLTGISTFHT